MRDAQPQTRPPCPRCGATFHCGAAEASCWCFDLPHVMPVRDGAYEGCLCPDCLRTLIAARQQPRQE